MKTLCPVKKCNKLFINKESCDKHIQKEHPEIEVSYTEAIEVNEDSFYRPTNEGENHD
jgi:hypothetical protein